MIQTIDNLEKELKTGNLSGIYLFYGEEQFLLETNVKKIKSNFGESLLGINYIAIEENNIMELLPDIQTPAFGYEKKLILVKNSNLLKKDGKKKDTKLIELRAKLANYIEENIQTILQSLVLVFIESEIDVKLELYKIIEKYAVVCNFERQKPAQLSKRIKSICKAYQVTIEDATIKYLLECCGTNMQDLINEIRKLIEYVGKEGIITAKEVDLLCTKQIESIIFELTDSLGKKDIASAIQVLHNLLYAKEPIQKILITLYNHFKKLYLVSVAQNTGKDIATSINLKPNQIFLVGKYKMQAAYFPKQELKNILKELADMDYHYKIGLIDLNIGLESILCRYCS